MNILQASILVIMTSVVISQSPYRPKTVDGDFCMTPFEDKGKTYHDCTTDNDPKPWCKTSADKVAYCAAAPAFSGCNIGVPTTTVLEVQSILQFINDARAKEPAVRMAKLKWNTELAKRAQFMSNQCQLGNNDMNLCSSASAMGQISYMSQSSAPQPKKWNALIQEFLNQKSSYNFDTNVCSGDYCPGYKQLVNAQTTDVGCAVTSCNKPDEFVDYYFCNFYPPLYGDRPYEKGSGNCNNCFTLADNTLFRCNNNLCEICDKPAADCKGKP